MALDDYLGRKKEIGEELRDPRSNGKQQQYQAMPQYNPQKFDGPSNNDYPGGGPGGQLPIQSMTPPLVQTQAPMVQPGFLAVPPLVQQQMPSMPSAYNQIDLPQMPPMGHAYTNLQPMQTPQPYQGGTAGGPGPNFTDAIAAGYAQATSLNETVDSVPKDEHPSDEKQDPGVSNDMEIIEARLRELKGM